MIITEGQGVVIEKLKKLIKELNGGFGWQLEGWGGYLIVAFLSMPGKYTIVETPRVNLVGKVNV